VPVDLDGLLRHSGLDRYDRNARLYPAFLSLLPLFVTIVLWFPPAWSMLAGLLSLTASFGTFFLLSQLIRYRGRLIESQLGPKVGREKTATLLGHTNLEVPRGSKKRYHDYLRRNGFNIPTEDQEHADPAAAHDTFRSAVDWLLVHLRPKAKASGLLSENIAYGFRRNMLGIKPAALTLLLLAIAINGAMLWKGSDQDRVVAGAVVEVIFACATVAWVFVITAAFVEDASAAYAKRFLELLEPKKVGPRQR